MCLFYSQIRVKLPWEWGLLVCRLYLPMDDSLLVASQNSET